MRQRRAITAPDNRAAIRQSVVLSRIGLAWLRQQPLLRR